MRERFISKNFMPQSWDLIERANDIISEYQDAGYRLTLRQLYYQFVARDWLPNNKRSYDRLGSVINDARLAGEVDWSAIEDRARNLQVRLRLDGPRDAIETIAAQYHIDMWANQRTRVEVWIEKAALIGVISAACRQWDVPHLACVGYLSASEMYEAACRARRHAEALAEPVSRVGQDTVILHLGDHDPSGIDMTRDNQDRLNLMTRRARQHGARVEVRRIALSMAQIEQYDPPPNPAKLTDCRANDYIDRYGVHSWELDALEPAVLDALVRDTIQEYIDPEAWAAKVDERDEGLAVLNEIIGGMEDDA